MNNKYIFDLLLEGGGIDRVYQLYPPHNQEDLDFLLQAIEVSDYDDLKRECLVYYLLKWHNDGREVKFQAERSIPAQFANLADAYWHIDSGNDIARAISILSDRRLNGDYASQILHSISMTPDPSPLIVQYVRTAKPRLIHFTDIWTYTLALIDTNFLEAWQFQRTFSETNELRSKLLNKILNWVISTALLPNTMKALLNLPLSPFEQKFLHKYALEPPETLERTAIPLLRELVCVRLIQSGKYAEAVKLDHEFASSTLHESKADAEPRRKMVKELYDALPLPERTLLDAELDRITRGKNPAPTVNGVPKPKPKPRPSSPIKEVNMSDSWEEIPRPSQPSGILANGHVPARAAPSLPAPLSNSLLGFSSSRNGAPPILPVSTVTASAHRPRPSFPLSSSLTSSTSRQPVLFPPSTPTSTKNGIRPPASVSQPLGESTSFTPASRKANAFYQPPPANPPQGVKRPFESRDADADADVDVDVDVDGEDEDMDTEQADEHGDEDNNQEVTRDADQQERETQEPEWEQRELGFSVFGNSTQPPKSSKSTAAPRSQPQLSQVPSNERRVPPGAFASDDEAEHEVEHEPSPPPAKTRASTRSSKASTRSAAAKETETTGAPEPKRAKRSEHPKSKPRQSVPGALVNSDDDDGEDEEEEDDVAPLPSPPRRGAARKAREMTPSSDVGDDEAGGQTRRRSSRLSSGDAVKKTPSASASGVGKAKKTTKGSATKKRR
ncbi:hypothetical protein H0H92_002157 [Tricholoma furcatifolium]|nr:hypothetical protein H0H92_002157 [Tricholoma furcatifolium]